MRRKVVVELLDESIRTTYSDESPEDIAVALDNQAFVCIGSLVFQAPTVKLVNFMTPEEN